MTQHFVIAGWVWRVISQKRGYWISEHTNLMTYLQTLNRFLDLAHRYGKCALTIFGVRNQPFPKAEQSELTLVFFNRLSDIGCTSGSYRQSGVQTCLTCPIEIACEKYPDLSGIAIDQDKMWFKCSFV